MGETGFDRKRLDAKALAFQRDCLGPVNTKAVKLRQ
jgi:hypothetical protein